jgi:hypothetical protein
MWAFAVSVVFAAGEVMAIVTPMAACTQTMHAMEKSNAS